MMYSSSFAKITKKQESNNVTAGKERKNGACKFVLSKLNKNQTGDIPFDTK